MATEKAYKLLAQQEGISNKEAKTLMDSGQVHARGIKIKVARAQMDIKTRFKVVKKEKATKIHEDKNVLVLNKPAFVTCSELEKTSGYKLLHRLDKETSGILVLCKDETWRQKAITEFKKGNVQKEYVAVVSTNVIESIEINAPISTTRKNNKAYSKIDKNGKEALTLVEPLLVSAKISKIKVAIPTGRTHQIRVHLQSVGAPIVGDEQYGGKPAKRMMLHSSKMALLDYEWKCSEPESFTKILNL